MMNSTPSSAVAMNIWKPRIRDSNTELPPNFVPFPYTVHIGRGKVCSDATGNRRLKVIVDSFLQEYRQATTKIEKSVIVSKIVDIVHDACPVGAFVKCQKGKWVEVGDYAAREKVGSMLRDALSEKYRSSSKAKLARRKKAKDAVYQAAKSNVINAILSIKTEEQSDSESKPQEQQKQEKVEAATPTKKQSPDETRSSSSCAATTKALPSKKKLSTMTMAEMVAPARTEVQVLRDLKQGMALEQSFSSNILGSQSCAPLQQLSSFYDINYNNASVGLQWYSL